MEGAPLGGAIAQVSGAATQTCKGQPGLKSARSHFLELPIIPCVRSGVLHPSL